MTHPPTRAEMRREAYLRLLWAIIGERNGVHLAELYSALRRYDHWADRTDQELRALLDDIGVPVERTMRVGTVTGRSGIYLADVLDRMTGIPIPSPPPTPKPAPHREEAGHRHVERSVERGVERLPPPAMVVVGRPEDEAAWP